MANNRKRLLVVAIAICLGLLIMDRLIAGPLIDGWKNRAAQITKLQAQIKKGEALIDHKDSYETRWNEMVKNSLPAEQSQAELMIYAAINDWSKAGLTLNRQAPQWITDKDGSRHVEFRVLATGSISSIARFLYDVERDPRALRIQDVEISSRDENGRNLSLNMLLTGAVLRGGRNG